jgi:CO/xanthine dehydrogenase FAD-binding subunit
MKPAPFDYVRPATLAEACELLAGDEDARLIAGGQTLVPMLAMRLARPAKLIDIMRLPELAGIRQEDGADGAVVVGATTRQVQAERDPVIRASVPLLARVLPWVGHPPTRNRGTVGGSVANADPSAEIPLVAVTLGADIQLATPAGPASTPADDFFIGPMLTTIGQGECISAISFPVWHGRIGTGFFEISARRSDFAFVAAVAQVALDDDDRCVDVALGVGGAGDRPLRLDVSRLKGTKLDAASLSDAVKAASGGIDAMSDLHASAAYRRRVAVTLCLRALEQARDDAAAKPSRGAR